MKKTNFCEADKPPFEIFQKISHLTFQKRFFKHSKTNRGYTQGNNKRKR